MKALGRSVARAGPFVERKVRDWTRPDREAPLLLGLITDLTRSKRELLAENALLQQQLIVAHRQFKRPKLGPRDRLRLLLLARLAKYCWDTMLLVKPETILRWHRAGFRLFWRRKTRTASNTPRLSPEAVALIIRLSKETPLWGAPRVHGELLKLGISVSQPTAAKYMVRHRKPSPQTWRTFLASHVHDLVSVDFLTVPTVTFRVSFVFIVLSHHRRRVIHFNVTERPTAACTAQQIVEAFPWNTAPRYLLRDRDGIYGGYFHRRVDRMDICEVPIAPRLPWQNPFVERMIGSIRRECLDHVIVLNEQHLRRTIVSYLRSYHAARRHLSLDKDAPDGRTAQPPDTGKVVALPHLGGPHHEYMRVAA